jgi:hypothetical protein
MNRRASADAGPSGLTWIIATVIIFFIMIFYLIVLNLMGSEKVVREIFTGDEITVNLYGASNDIVLQESFFAFLNSGVEFEGENLRVRDLVKGELEGNENKFEKFRGLSQDFLDSYFKVEGESDYEYISIIIKDLDEEHSPYFPSIYSDYFSYGGEYSYTRAITGSKPCLDPGYDRSLIKVFVPESKFLELCVEYNEND